MPLLNDEERKSINERLAISKEMVSDQQCAVGLHVLRAGYRPEWCGLCEANHNLIQIEVKVNTQDICFAGLPTMDAKVRVRRLEVIS